MKPRIFFLIILGPPLTLLLLLETFILMGALDVYGGF